jgi:hypothetical protein
MKGLCHVHYKRGGRAVGGDPRNALGRGMPGKARGIRALNGEYVTGNGYRKIRVAPADGSKVQWILEHRLVMEKKFGRPLYSDENIHHIDGNKLNNAPENLELWLTRQPQGQRVEDLLVWAREIIERYG